MKPPNPKSVAGRGGDLGRLLATTGREGGAAVATAITALAGGRQHLRRLLRERYPTVAVTGMTGVGKTALVDRISRHAATTGQADVGSAVLEKRRRTTTSLRGFRFRVVPGENAATRLGALDQVFHDEVVDGVLHVVANGYATGRRVAGISGAASIDREVQLARELEDWTITAHRIASMAVRRARPTWLVIAVTKVDLYPEEIESVVRAYSPGAGTPFAVKLDELRALAGAAKLSVDVLPVCAEGGKHSPISAKQRDAYVAALELRMAQLCGHR
ncbi:MAG: GTPase domain-containing protein [Kineosporiaceae bacterium]|nr:GTPase domain-containing protein [Kineosporiaceae bacterium]